MKMQTLLVGSHFRPPAKAALTSLPAGQELELRPEPENPYDPNAIAVWLDCKTVDRRYDSGLEEALIGSGHDWTEIRSQEMQLHLGYVAATGGKPLANTDYPGNSEVLKALEEGGVLGRAKLGFDPSGKPLVILQKGDL